MTRRLQCLIALVAALASAPLAAHDMWIEPAQFGPQAGQTIAVQLRVGENLVGDALPFVAQRVRQFLVDDPAQRSAIVGRPGAAPAGLLRVGGAGLQVIGYHSHATEVELPADKFNAYLLEEGLEAIAERRVRQGRSGAPVREQFLRCAKSLIQVGPASDVQADRRLGFPLELVAERNPYVAANLNALPLRLTYLDRPLAGALVVALNRANPADKRALRTDADGRVRFALHDQGMWLIKAVHMVEAAAESNAQWVSYWASLTFEPRAASAH